MAIAYVNGATGTNSATFASPVAGYIQVAFAFRDGSNTAPTVPTPPTGNAWTTAPTAGSGANTCGSVLVYRVVASSSDTGTGTFTNATSIVVAQYSGADNTTPVGTNDSDTGASSSTVNFNAVTFVGGSTSWAIGVVGHRQTDGTITTAPSGMTNRLSVSDATDQAALHDTNGGVSGWSTTSAALGGTASGYRARVIELRAASGSPYTMTAAQGSYTYTGQTTGLLWKRLMTAAQGSYTLTGQATNFVHGYVMTAAQGAYAYTGQATGLLWKRVMAAVQGAYTYTGQTTGILWNRLLTAAQGAYTYTGFNAGLRAAKKILADQGSYLLTGQNVTLTYTPAGSYSITADHGSYALTGQDVTLTYTPLNNYTIPVDQGSYILTGQSVNFVYTPITPTPTNNADIGGDYSSIRKEYPLRGAIKRKRLRRSEVKKIKEIVANPPTIEQLETLTRELLPGLPKSDAASLAGELNLGLDLAMKEFLAGIYETQSALELQAKQQRERERIVTIAIAAYQQMMEDDEVLLAYLI